jgi:hypothetical protein
MTTQIGILTAVLAFSACNVAPAGPTRHESKSFDRDKADRMHVELKMGAGELNVEGGAAHQADLDFTYNVDEWKPRVDYHSSGSTADLAVEQPSSAGMHNNTEYHWDVRLNDALMTDVVAKLGAGQAKMTLGSLQLRDVHLEMGAGEATIDLRGRPTRSYDVRVEGGAGQATIYLPKSVGIMATATGGLGDIQTEGLVERNGRWVNAGHENDPVTLHVDVKGGVGEIRLLAQ